MPYCTGSSMWRAAANGEMLRLFVLSFVFECIETPRPPIPPSTPSHTHSTTAAAVFMCLWKNDYFTKCGHQPIYLQNICRNRTVVQDPATEQCVVRACSSIEVHSVESIHDFCPDCCPPEILGR